TCIKYADLLINATASRRPAFITIPENWYTIFNPGNSNESIFEVNWDGNTYNQTGGPSAMYTTGTNPNYQYSTKMSEDLENDYMEVITGKDAVRSWYGASIIYNDGENPVYCIWKYKMGDTDPTNLEAMRLKDDANWIIYRMADIMLMKAEALIWKGKENWQEAVDIMNQIRTRANLPEKTLVLDEEDESSMMENYLLPERNIELAAEGKRWYDMIRYAKSKNYAHKSAFITLVQQYNMTANASWIRSVLQNEYAWYLPIHADEIENNNLLVQNPYYGITGNN
ncbi:RagB/SusD family nutrient uptake outer membrane protein, partial [Bacteroides finegoldii]